MRKLVYYVGVSLDGYISGPNDEFDFYPVSDQMAAWINDRYPEMLPTHVRRLVGLEDAPNRAFDTLVMGRGTYEPALAIPTTSPYAHLRQYIVSSTLTIDDPTVHVETGDPIELVRRLKAEDTGMDIYLCGGGKLAASLLPEIDEIILKSYPVVAGAGIPMFSGEFRPTMFTPTARESFDNGTQVTWLTRA
ncbi:dihydrofolate reductase family protein [Spongiactinospora sp. TRM90649]|uniref:dihydrofolate reductase family protein n=1 Tax=Spongiactinospora sp. TRM90649 TaxID=3031114 RepID=UPI0023F8D80A|nr:dihydrofolate reductase family protein [Spongiactinospora sp. TRM90649]MDF5755105.1 dihydrofolate reductase family protein [Spongiactinospora sp. TRM90649]